MSDRPCNLAVWLELWRKSRSEPVRPRLVRSEDGRYIEIWIGDDHRGSFGAVPSPVDCAAFGGECECG